jgi:hypothetical protein
VCFIGNGFDVRKNRLELLRSAGVPRCLDLRHGLQLVEGERFAKYLSLRRNSAAKADIAAVHFLASLNRCTLLDRVEALDQRRVDLVLRDPLVTVVGLDRANLPQHDAGLDGTLEIILGETALRGG